MKTSTVKPAITLASRWVNSKKPSRGFARYIYLSSLPLALTKWLFWSALVFRQVFPRLARGGAKIARQVARQMLKLHFDPVHFDPARRTRCRSDLASLHRAPDIVGLANRKCDNRQRRIAGGAGRELTAIRDEQDGEPG